MIPKDLIKIQVVCKIAQNFMFYNVFVEFHGCSYYMFIYYIIKMVDCIDP